MDLNKQYPVVNRLNEGTGVVYLVHAVRALDRQELYSAVAIYKASTKKKPKRGDQVRIYATGIQ